MLYLTGMPLRFFLSMNVGIGGIQAGEVVDRATRSSRISAPWILVGPAPVGKITSASGEPSRGTRIRANIGDPP